MKYIGKLFRSHDTEVRESELIVFLTPEVITPYSAGTLRQQHAGYVGTEQLDAIPHAEVGSSDSLLQRSWLSESLSTPATQWR